MDTSQISAATSLLQSQKTGDAVGLSVLKKALDSQTQAAQQLIGSLPQPASKPTATLGNHVNTYA